MHMDANQTNRGRGLGLGEMWVPDRLEHFLKGNYSPIAIYST